MARFIVRLIRVILVTAVWLAIVFGPVAACLYFDYPFADPPPWALESARPVAYANQATSYQAQPTFHFGAWHIAAAAWAALALIGSVWGLSRWLARRRQRFSSATGNRGAACAGALWSCSS